MGNIENHHASAPKPTARRRNWRHIHHSPLFWFGFALFLTAIAIYVLTGDLSQQPRVH